MAKQDIVKYGSGRPYLEVIELSKTEALEIVSLLTAQLAGTALKNRMLGASPEVAVFDDGDKENCLPPKHVKRLVLSVKTSPWDNK